MSRVCAAGTPPPAACAAGVVPTAGLSGPPIHAAVELTSAPADVVVRQGRQAVFHYRVDAASRLPVPVELRIGRGGRRIVTVHLGRRRPGTALRHRLVVTVAPGRYVWAVVPDDPLAGSSASAGLLTVR